MTKQEERNARQLAGIKAAYGGEPVNFDDPKWRFDERVKRLRNKWHFTKEEAEQIVRKVILEKELTTGV